MWVTKNDAIAIEVKSEYIVSLLTGCEDFISESRPSLVSYEDL